ncbi:MAG: hypothetical protein H0X29_06080 [Parachlamydiaceae bacterium]|nr:hypothetical protein [Parachlamydiaceae bacterium]
MSSSCPSQNAIEMLVAGLRSKNRNRVIQYLKLTKEMQFNDLSGRWTTLVEVAIGYVLDEEEIVILPGATWDKKQKMLEEMMSVYDKGQIYALVGGYPCALGKNEYTKLDIPPFHCIGELI